ncbi:MAG: AI-2E family transporter [Formosimonas sp.]
MNWTQLVKAALALAVIVAFFWLSWTIKHILVPFFFAGLLAYLLNPIVQRLHARGLNRGLGAGIAVLVTLLVLGFIVVIPWPILSQQLAILQQKLPTMIAHAQVVAGQSTLLQEYLPANDGTSWLAHIQAYVAEHVNVSNLSQQLWLYFKQGSSVLMSVLTWLVLMPVLTFYLLANWPSTVKRLRRLVPTRWRYDAFTVTSQMDYMLSQFIRGQLLLMVCLATYYAIALKFTGLDVAIPVGILTGCFVIIPFVGFGLGLVLGALSALLQFGLTTPFFAVLAVYALGQVLEGYVLTPRLVGERIGLSPVAVIFSLLVFGALFGFLGMLFALPAAAVVAVLVRFMRERYFDSAFYRASR